MNCAFLLPNDATPTFDTKVLLAEIQTLPTSVVNLASPVGMVNLASPVGVVNMASPVGVVNLASPVGVVNLASPVGVVNPAPFWAQVLHHHMAILATILKF